MKQLEERNIACPYCGETIDILIDASVAEQCYVEDCQVCCQPMVLDVTVTYDDEIFVQVKREDE